MMAYVRQQEAQSADSFSYLYLANVLGAMGGALLTAVALIEIFGFHDTLRVAAAANFAIFGISLLLASAARGAPSAVPGGAASTRPLTAAPAIAAPGLAAESGRFIQALLFTTGLVSHGHGGGLDTRLRTGAKDPSLFLCCRADSLFGRHVWRLVALSAPSAAAHPRLDGPIGSCSAPPLFCRSSRTIPGSCGLNSGRGLQTCPVPSFSWRALSPSAASWAI